MKRYVAFPLLTIALVFLASCEEEFTPDTSGEISELVVEGYIEAGEDPRPVFVFLTRAIPFFSTLDVSGFNDIYVKGADVRVTDGEGNSVQLTEVCWASLDPAIKEIVAEQLGLPSSDIQIDLCAYVDLLNQINRVEGEEYLLEINADGQSLSAITSIPKHVPLDSLWFEPPRGEPNDTMAELWCLINDPADEENYYRYLTATNDGPLIAGFTTVTDDAFFNGKTFDFPLTKSEDPGEDIDPANFGLFRRGDTARIKWMNLDREHYFFWQTLETSRTRQGPFSSYVRIASNVSGGLGIWGGYSVSYYELPVPPL